MSALFAKTIKQALQTFDKKNVTSFGSNLKTLKQLANQLTIQDINLNSDLLSEEVFRQAEKAPCTYVHIFQTKDVSMSVFILRGGYTMPCHDHPMMHGVLRGLYGTLLIRSCTKLTTTNADEPPSYNLKAKEIDVICDPENVVTNSTECAILTPTERNFHEITALGGVAAFFDILSPPYDSDIPIYGKRKCSFYKKLQNDNDGENSSQKCTLLKISAPLDYYCDSSEYNLPESVYEFIYENTQ